MTIFEEMKVKKSVKEIEEKLCRKPTEEDKERARKNARNEVKSLCRELALKAHAAAKVDAFGEDMTMRDVVCKSLAPVLSEVEGMSEMDIISDLIAGHLTEKFVGAASYGTKIEE